MIEGLRWFVRVAESGSFSAVAREAMTNQVTVGRRISMLENHFRVTLFRRSTRNLTLTDDGRVFLARARRILREVDALETEIHGRDRHHGGHVRIGTTSMFGLHLARSLVDFHRRYPAITVEMILSDGFVNMIEDGLDLAMRTGQIMETTVAARHLGDVDRHLVAAPHYLAGRPAPECAADLQHHDCVLFSYGSTRQIWNVDGEAVRVSGTYRTNSSLAQHEAVRSGLGISLFPYFQVEADLRAGELVRLLPDSKMEPIPFYVTYPANETLAPRVRAVMNWITSEAKALTEAAPDRP
ncbi:LysR family transcriptional regulator [Sphingomonas sp. NFR15]|uniref:LysR family transcriptional regulator n=1 Tax=Sphingomonas sp. NFR15 TaxID=1566282 RepID=UPI00087E9173|nr:LysR family transcriptional regulator [Sphingomonas sp. NFR15]SDA19980.1 transcriptional regulator, LysR family [Sphingomonas sp. NFR15]